MGGGGGEGGEGAFTYSGPPSHEITTTPLVLNKTSATEYDEYCKVG